MGLFSRFERSVENTVEGVADRLSNAPVSPAAIAKRCEKRMHSERMVGSGKQYAPTLYTVLVNPQDDRQMMGYYPTLSGELETMLAARAAEAGLTMDGQPLVRFIADASLKSGRFDVIAETVAAPIVEQLRDDELQRYGITRGRYEAELAQKKARARMEAQEARREELRARSEERAEREARMQARGRRGAARRDQEEAPEDEFTEEQPEDWPVRRPEGRPEGRPPRMPRRDAGQGVDARGGFGEVGEYVAQQAYFGSKPDAEGRRELPFVPEEEIDRSVDYGEYTFNSLDFNEMDGDGGAGEGTEQPDPRQLTLPPEAPREEAAARAAYPERPSRPFADAQAQAAGAPPVAAAAQPGRAAQARPVYRAPQRQAAQDAAAPAAAPAAPATPAAAAPIAPAAPAAPASPAAPAARAATPVPGIPAARAAVSSTATTEESAMEVSPNVPANNDSAASAATSAPASAAAYRTPITFTPASKIAPEARAMPAKAIPGILDRPQEPGVLTATFDRNAEKAKAKAASISASVASARASATAATAAAASADAALEGEPTGPKTLPYSDLGKPTPRFRIRNLQNGRSYTLTGTRVYIGRDTACNIVVADANVSRRHAELRTNGKGVWTLTDMGSTNGTYLNGTGISTAVLADGDRITVGITDLIFVVS